MEFIKRILTSSLIVLILTIAFSGSYAMGFYSYADDYLMSDKELDAAYQAYLQSKGGTLIGDLGARTAYVNGKFANWITSSDNTTPYKNLNAVKQLYRWERQELSNGRSVLSLAMGEAGASVFALYTQKLLQDKYFGDNAEINNNGVFDSGVNDNIYSGEYFVDDDGHACLVYNALSASNASSTTMADLFSEIGSKYKFNGYELKEYINSGNTTLINNIAGNVYTYPLSNNSTSERDIYTMNNLLVLGGGASTVVKESQNIIYKRSGVYYFGLLQTKVNYSSQALVSYDKVRITQLSPASGHDYNVSNTNLYFNTNNINNVLVYPTINANGELYITPKVKVNLDGTVKYQPYTFNEGDTVTNIVNNYYTDSGTTDKTITVPDTSPYEPDPDDFPSGGDDNPSGGNTPNDWQWPNLTPDGDGGFNFNFNLPDLNIDWNISGLQEKFPFSIPFDLISFIRVLDAEPETPEIQGTINLLVYQWNLDLDLHDFDNLAYIVRNVEFIGFCITLILITRRMIKG